MIKHYINFKYLTRLAATLTLLLSFGLMSQAQGQYTGAGEFNLITSEAELEDGYYVVTNAPGEFAMNNAHTGSLLPETSISPVDGTLTNPDVTDVWRIEANGDGYTIFSEESGEYVSYTGDGNSIQVDTAVEGDAQRWSFDYFTGDGEFEVRNLATTERALRYNSGAPRFVAYATTFGDNLNLYKFDDTSAEEPALVTDPNSIDGLDYAVGEGPSASQTVDVSGQNLDPADATITMTAPEDFEVSLDDVTYSNSVTADASAGELASTTVYVRLSDGGTAGTYSGDLTVAGGGATDATVSLSGEVIVPLSATLPYSEDFDPDLSEVSVVDVSGQNTWEQGSSEGRTFAQANGFNTGETEETWLILPGFDLTATSDEVMQFNTSYNFGNDDADNFLKLVYSTDYSGAGDPSGSTWTELPFTKPDASETVTPSGNIDLSGISVNEVYLAFQYRYEPGNYRLWRVSDVEIFEASEPILTVNPSELDEFSYRVGNGPSDPQSVIISGSNLDGSDVSITAPDNFEIAPAEDGSYGTSGLLAAFDGNDFTLYVRMEAGLPEGSYSGAVEITGGGAPATSVDVAGNVTAPLPALAGGEEYIQQFHDFESIETLPGGWSVSDESYEDVWGAGTSAGLRGESVLGYQHTSGTGTFTATLELVNETGAELSDLYVSYTGRVERTTVGRSPIWTVEVDGVEQTVLSYSTENGLETTKFAVISGLSIPDGSSFSISWSSDRGEPSGAAKQIGISDVVVSDDAFVAASLLGSQGYRILSTPVTNASYADVLDRIWTQGYTGADFDTGTSNVFVYDEASRAYQSPDNASNRFGTVSDVDSGIGKASLVFTYADDDRDQQADPFPKLLLYNGNVNAGDVVLPLSYTDSGTAANDGYHLVGNPYSTTLDWNALVTDNRNVNVQDVFYIYDHSIDAYRLINGTPSGSDETNPNTLLPAHQGGWVKATGAGATLTFEEADQVDDGAELNNEPDAITYFRMNLVAEDREDYVGFIFSDDASTGIDQRDVYQLQPLTDRFAHLYSSVEGALLLENNLPAEFNELELPLGVHSSIAGPQELNWNNISEMPSEWNIELVDLHTGTRVDMRTNDSYVFEHQPDSDSKKSSRAFSGLDETESPVLKLNEKQEERFVVNINLNATSAPVGGELPQELALGQNYPNPFNPATQISYDLPESADVRLDVYNVQGQRVATLVNASQTAGSYNVSFDAGNLASGVYLYRLQTGNSVLTRKMTLVK